MSVLLILVTSMPHVLTPMAPIPVSAMVDSQEMDSLVEVCLCVYHNTAAYSLNTMRIVGEKKR